MVTVKEKMEMNFPGLFSRDSETATKKRNNWDRFVYPPASADSKKRKISEFMIYSPFEEVTGTVTDAQGNLLPLFKLKIINLNGYRKETLMTGDSVVRSLAADIVNNNIPLDDELTNIAGLVYSVESVILKGEVPNKKTGEMEKKIWHKFTINLDKSLPEEGRSTSGVEAYLQDVEIAANATKETKEQDRVTVAQGSIETTEKKNADAMFGDKPAEATAPQG